MQTPNILQTTSSEGELVEIDLSEWEEKPTTNMTEDKRVIDKILECSSIDEVMEAFDKYHGLIVNLYDKHTRKRFKAMNDKILSLATNKRSKKNKRTESFFAEVNAIARAMHMYDTNGVGGHIKVSAGRKKHALVKIVSEEAQALGIKDLDDIINSEPGTYAEIPDSSKKGNE